MRCFKIEHYHLFKKLKGQDWDILDSNDQRLLSEISEIYNNAEWVSVMNVLVRNNMNYARKNMITKNAYHLSRKVKSDIGVDVFPVVERVYLGSMHNEEGYATWRMYKSNLFLIGSNQPVKDFLLKRNTIVEMRDGTSRNNVFVFAQKA